MAREEFTLDFSANFGAMRHFVGMPAPWGNEL